MTTDGRIYCFGAEAAPATVHTRPVVSPPPDTEDAWSGRARDLLEATGAREGYGLVLGLGTGRRAEELLRQSKLRLIGLDPDPQKVEALRERFDAQGLYGDRIALLTGDLDSVPMPPYLASLVVSEDLPAAGQAKAVIIAAGSGKSLLPLTEDRPKCMLDIKGRTILERQIETLRACGVQDIVVVRGYKKEVVTAPGVRFYDNDRYDETGELASLFAAEGELTGPLLFLYSDILFEQAVLEKLLRAEADCAIVVDRAWVDQRERMLPLGKPLDLVITKNAPQGGLRSLPATGDDTLLAVGQRIRPEQATGEFIGLARFSERGAQLAREAYHERRAAAAGRFHEADSLEQGAFTDLLQDLVERGHAVACVDVYKGWLEIDTFEDYQRAWAEIRK